MTAGFLTSTTAEVITLSICGDAGRCLRGLTVEERPESRVSSERATSEISIIGNIKSCIEYVNPELGRKILGGNINL